MSTPATFDLHVTRRQSDCVIVSFYPDSAGSRYLGGRLRLRYRDYVAMATKLGVQVLAEKDIPLQPRLVDLYDEIRADAGDELRRVSAVQERTEEASAFLREHPVHSLVGYRLTEGGKVYTGVLRSEPFTLGWRLCVWVADQLVPLDMITAVPEVSA